jgi:sterol desaturase/sphingolipid hydroxylase (fatty acid hydroxylase superfamily)
MDQLGPHALPYFRDREPCVIFCQNNCIASSIFALIILSRGGPGSPAGTFGSICRAKLGELGLRIAAGARKDMIDLASCLPWPLPLSILVWAAQMAVFHGAGLFFEWSDRTRVLAFFKVRDVDRLSYFELLPRVLVNQIFILLPAMVALQYTGLAFTGAPHLSVLHFFAGMALMGIGHDIVQYVFHRFVLHRPSLFRQLGHSVHHSTGASKAISACYMSVADFFLEIVLPYLIPLALAGAGADVSFHLTVACLGAIGGLYEHSGYDFAIRLRRPNGSGSRVQPLAWLSHLVTSKAHGEHHRRSNVSFSDGFGSPGICDTIFRTRWDMAEAAEKARSAAHGAGAEPARARQRP